MKLHHLRDFTAVARSGGIRPAARELSASTARDRHFLSAQSDFPDRALALCIV